MQSTGERWYCRCNGTGGILASVEGDRCANCGRGRPVEMPCADEGGYRREFVPEMHNGELTGDYTCATCGWMQRSFEHGKIELAWNVLNGVDPERPFDDDHDPWVAIRVAKQILDTADKEKP